jgi:hypothetical protein
MKTLLCILLVTASVAAAADQTRDEMLQRVYAIRAKFDQDQNRADQEAMAHAPLAGAAVDSPTVSDMRHDMQTSLTQIQQNYRCMKIDVDNTSGNTTIICGNSNGDVSSEHTNAARDVITVGEQP